MRLNNINLNLGVRLKQTDSAGADVLDVAVDLLTKTSYKIEKGFTDVLFYELPNGVLTGNDATVQTGFYAEVYDVNGNVVVTTDLGKVDAYEKEDSYVYTVNLQKVLSTGLATSAYVKGIKVYYRGDEAGSAVDTVLITTDELGLSTFATDDGSGNKGILLASGLNTEVDVKFEISFAK